MKASRTVKPDPRQLRERQSRHEGQPRRILMQGRLGGTGKLVILPVDQGFEHGPARSFAANPAAYDPHYHYQLAIDAGLNAYAAPLGMLEAGADTFAGQIPTILKVNSSNSWATSADQAVTGARRRRAAPRLRRDRLHHLSGLATDCFDMMEEIREMSRRGEASVGLATVIWSYPRGGELSKDGETGARRRRLCRAHGGAARRAHHQGEAADRPYRAEGRRRRPMRRSTGSTQAERVAHVVQACFDGRRIVVFSGGAAKGTDAVYEDARDIRDGGGNGSIIGRNTFQRPRDDALAMLDKLVDIYKGRD